MDINTTVHSDGRLKEGVLVEELSSWEEFHQKVMNLTAKRGYIWRGQKKDKDNDKPWFLKSSFDRNLGSENKASRDELLKRHIGKVKREMEQSHPNVLPNREDDIWALGQHYGLETPLLDWTLSPYIAAYFAFEERIDEDDSYRCVYALSRSVTRLLSKGKEINRFVGVIEQLTHPSPRFLAQKGIFTKALDGNDIETTVKEFSKRRPNEVPLVKFTIPAKYRDDCLRELNLMNINHTTLLLDLRDVADRCNKLRDCDRPPSSQ
jgi:hypothetical protein